MELCKLKERGFLGFFLNTRAVSQRYAVVVGSHGIRGEAAAQI